MILLSFPVVYSSQLHYNDSIDNTGVWIWRFEFLYHSWCFQPEPCGSVASRQMRYKNLSRISQESLQSIRHPITCRWGYAKKEWMRPARRWPDPSRRNGNDVIDEVRDSLRRSIMAAKSPDCIHHLQYRIEMKAQVQKEMIKRPRCSLPEELGKCGGVGPSIPWWLCRRWRCWWSWSASSWRRRGRVVCRVPLAPPPPSRCPWTAWSPRSQCPAKHTLITWSHTIQAT